MTEAHDIRTVDIDTGTSTMQHADNDKRKSPARMRRVPATSGNRQLAPRGSTSRGLNGTSQTR